MSGMKIYLGPIVTISDNVGKTILTPIQSATATIAMGASSSVPSVVTGITADGILQFGFTIPKATSGILPQSVNAAGGVAGIDSLGSISAQTVIPFRANTGRTLSSLFSDTFSVKDYGVVADGKVLTDAMVSMDDGTVASPTYYFASTDVGKLIAIAGGSANGDDFTSHIVDTFNGVALLTDPVPLNVANATVTFGTDDTAAWEFAITQASSTPTRILFPAGISIISSTLQWLSGVSLIGAGAGTSVLKWISRSPMTGPMIQALSGTASNPYTDIHFSNFELDMDSALTTGAYTSAARGIFMQFLERLNIEQIYVHGSPATGIGCDYLVDSRIINNTAINCGKTNLGSNQGGAGISVAIGGFSDAEYFEVSGNIIRSKVASRYGILFESRLGTAQLNTHVVCTKNHISLELPDDIISPSGTAGIADSGVHRLDCSGNYILVNKNVGAAISVTRGTSGVAGIDTYISRNTCVGGISSVALYLNEIENLVDSRVNYVIENNRLSNAVGDAITVSQNPTVDMIGLRIANNDILVSGGSAIYLSARITSIATLYGVDIVNNTFEDNCQSASRDAVIMVDQPVSISGLTITGNIGRLSTQSQSLTTLYLLRIYGTVVNLTTLGNNVNYPTMEQYALVNGTQWSNRIQSDAGLLSYVDGLTLDTTETPVITSHKTFISTTEPGSQLYLPQSAPPGTEITLYNLSDNAVTLLANPNDDLPFTSTIVQSHGSLVVVRMSAGWAAITYA